MISHIHDIPLKSKHPKPSSRISRWVSPALPSSPQLSPALPSFPQLFPALPSSPQFSAFLAACIPGVEFGGQRSAKPQKVIVWVDAGCTATGVGCRFIAITCWTMMLCTMTRHHHQPPNYSQKGGLVMVQNHDALRCFDEDALNPKFHPAPPRASPPHLR